MDPATVRAAGSAAVAVPEAADPLEWHRGGEGTGRGDDVQDGRFSTNQTSEDPPITRRDEGLLGSSPHRKASPMGGSDSPDDARWRSSWKPMSL